MRGTARHDGFVLAVAALFLSLHLAWLPRHLEDIDSFNFALGVRDYDVAAHQPHPPGYPVFIAMGRAAAAVVSPWVADARVEAIALAGLAGLAGALGLLALHRLARATLRDHASRDAVLVTLLVGAVPLYWATASRPLSDMPGLAAALWCQWLLLAPSRSPDAGSPRPLLAAAVCGLAVGLRSQVAWLVVPLLAWQVIAVWRAGLPRRALGVAATALGGVLAWGVPMVAVTGGLEGYRRALTAQAGEDFDGVPMLILHPSPRRLAGALLETFVEPWGWWWLALPVIVAALVGIVALYGRRRLALWLGLGFGPYAVFHLLFQETETTRYALPLVVPVAVLAAIGLLRWTPRVGMAAVAVIAGVSVGVSAHGHAQYVHAGATVTEALVAIEAEARRAADRPVVVMHRRVWAETRRARAVVTPSPAFEVAEPARALEWREVTRALQAGDPRVWWLVDPRRGDRVAVDPRGVRLVRHVGWPRPVAALLGGMRPHAFDWYAVESPSWVLDGGWGLTPELAGLTTAAGEGPSGSGSTAWLRTHPGASTLLIGGRVIASPGTRRTLVVTIGERWRQETTVEAGSFAVPLDVPAGVLTGAPYVPLRVTAPGGRDAQDVRLEQFDVQPHGTPVLALEQGWYEPERDVSTGRQWRWVGDRSALRVIGTADAVRLDVVGTYPRHYDEAPRLEIRSGDRVIGTHVLPRPFALQVLIPAADLGPDGRLTWHVTPSFVAGERTGTADARRLALEIARVHVDNVR